MTKPTVENVTQVLLNAGLTQAVTETNERGRLLCIESGFLVESDQYAVNVQFFGTTKEHMSMLPVQEAKAYAEALRAADYTEVWCHGDEVTVR